MVTIYDVAKYAGVSKSTVSLVLNDSDLVKKQTRDKVLDAMRTLNYIPNSNARGLSAKLTYCLGIVIMTEEQLIPSYDFNQHTGLCSLNITNGIMSALVDTKYGALIENFCSTDYPGELPQIVKNHRVDGVFIVGSPYDKGMLTKIKDLKIPCVLVGVDSFEEDFDSVQADPGEGVQIGLRYLHEAGHKKILFMNCPSTFHSAYVREKAFYHCAAELGIAVDPRWCVNCRKNHGKSAYYMMRECWENGLRPDAVLAANGYLAMGAMRYLYEIGIKIPDEVSFFGYEDSSISGYCIPPLTTVNIHKEQMGKIAAEYLISRIEKPSIAIRNKKIPAEIVIRDSVKIIG